MKVHMTSVGIDAVLLICLFLPDVMSNTTVSDLYTTLFTGYRADVLPKCQSDQSVQLKVGLALRQIIDLNEPRQILETNTWVRLNWNDCQLRWNATTTGISNLVVPNNQVWIPDITLYDNAENTLGGLTDFRPNIYSDGNIYYNFPSVIKSLCKVDVTYFPFDSQTCRMKFGSWSYHGLDLNVSSLAPSGDTSAYISNGEWEIVGIPLVRHVLLYSCCVEPYPDVTFYIQLQRKSLFYMLNLLFPCMLISTMGFLGFLLPPDSGEKVSLEITVLLSLAVFLLVVSETMPPTSETFPYIGVYFACAMLLVSLSCLMTVTVLNIHFKGQFGKKMPTWVRKIFLQRLGRLLRVKVDHCDHSPLKTKKIKRCSVSPVHDNHAFMTDLDGTGTETNGYIGRETAMTVKESKEFKEFREITELSCLPVSDVGVANESVSLLREQIQCLRNIQAVVEEKRVRDGVVEDWQKLAQVIDRVFMVLFSIFQVTTTLAIMLRASIYDPDFQTE